MDDGNPYRLHVGLRRTRDQLLQDFLGLSAIARLCIRVSQGRQFAAAALRQLQRLLQLRDGLCVRPLLFVRASEKDVSGGELRSITIARRH